MSLSSVLQTVASGISAAEFSLGVIANNLANCQTPGFKAARVAFATQMPQTRSLGAAPTAHDGGSNPIQVGTGVFAAEVSTDFSQGSIALDSSPTSVAIEGDGLVDLMLSSTQFRANLEVLRTADDLLDDLMSLGRAR